MSTQEHSPSWSAEAGPKPWDGALVDLGALLAHGYHNTPDKIAVADHTTELTFQELETAARALAHRLRTAFDVKPGDAVVVLTRKWPIVPAIAAAIWKLNAIYVPIDETLPRLRLDKMIGRVNPAVIIGFEAQDAVHLPPFLCLQDWHHLTQARCADIPRSPQAPGDIAYIIHTSGSTGSPKGVQITHQNVSAYVHAHNDMLKFGAESRCLSFAPFHFDVSIEDTLLPLSVGGFVYLYHRAPFGAAMRKTLSTQRITHLIAVSTVLAVLSDKPDAISTAHFPDLEMIMTGAETCLPEILNMWKSACPHLRIYNVYGPTEVTIVCTGYEVTAPQPGRIGAFPIGQPLAGVNAVLRDDAGHIVTEPNAQGELCLGGVQVMAGYLADPQATARSLWHHEGQRYYRSGDICTHDANGDLVFLGRADSQIKLNGRRISLGEIQSECMSLPGISRAVAGVIDRGASQVIGVVLVSSDTTAIARARAHLETVLPSYACPALWDRVSRHSFAGTGKSNDRDLLATLRTTTDTQRSCIDA